MICNLNFWGDVYVQSALRSKEIGYSTYVYMIVPNAMVLWSNCISRHIFEEIYENPGCRTFVCLSISKGWQNYIYVRIVMLKNVHFEAIFVKYAWESLTETKTSFICILFAPSIDRVHFWSQYIKISLFTPKYNKTYHVVCYL